MIFDNDDDRDFLAANEDDINRNARRGWHPHNCECRDCWVEQDAIAAAEYENEIVCAECGFPKGTGHGMACVSRGVARYVGGASCPKCHGIGKVVANHVQSCARCGGTGRIETNAL